MCRFSAIYPCLILCAFLTVSANAQYKGGVGDGLGGKIALDTLGSLFGFAGGTHDGSGLGQSQSPAGSSQFFGGGGDGIDLLTAVEPTLFGFKGGYGDGFDGQATFEAVLFGFTGGIGDGQDVRKGNVAALFGFGGGAGDGNDMRKYLTKVWEGLINRQWTEPINWSDQKVPTKDDNVYVPNGKPFYPRLNNEILVIGDGSDPNVLHALTLHIAGNATLHGIGASVLYNYNFIDLRGSIDINSSAETGFLNLNGAILDLMSGAMMRVR